MLVKGKQNITYWTTNGLNGEGHPAWNAAVTVKGRWEDRLVLIDTEIMGEKLSSNSRAYMPLALEAGDYAYLGTSASASPIGAARRVIRTISIPSVNGRKTEYEVYLD